MLTGNLEITDLEKKESSLLSPMEKPSFPSGMSIYIDGDTYQKLGFMDAPKVGEEVFFKAKSFVESVEMEEGEGDVKKYAIRLQLTDIQFKDKKESVTLEDAFYGVK